jgi:hypothetical protein
LTSLIRFNAFKFIASFSTFKAYYSLLYTLNPPLYSFIAFILNEYINASRRDLVLIVREASRERLQMRIVNIIHVAYMPLYYVLLFLYSNPG